MRTEHCSRNWLVYDDGTAPFHFLQERDYSVRWPLPKDKVIRFCVEVAEEAMRQAEGEPVQPRTIAQIAAWQSRHRLPQSAR